MDTTLEQVRQELKNSVDERTKNTAQNFFKEEIKAYGVKIYTVNVIGKAFFAKIKDRSKADIIGLCEELWRSGYLEESFIACNWSYGIQNQYDPGDFEIFERWVQHYVNNWASCDTLCNHTVGEFIEKYPEYIFHLKQWAMSESRWIRRAAAVSLIIPARKGLFLDDIFQIANLLLLDKDDLVQKGYGWMLKAASQAYQKEVFDFVVQHKLIMPRTALRYAIEKMPKEMKAVAMEK